MQAQAPLSPESRDRRASGSFVDFSLPTFVGEEAHHPIKKMVEGSCKTKETQLLGSSRCNGILFVSSNQLMSLNIPQKGFDLDEDPNELHEVIAGALGTTCSNAFPAYIELAEAISDTYVICQPNEALLFNASVVLPADFFADAENPKEGAVTRPFPGDTVIVRIPRTMPRPVGYTIQEGNVVDQAVATSCEDCHPILAAWLKIQKRCHKLPSRLISASKIRKLGEEFLPPNPFEVPTGSKLKVNLALLNGDKNNVLSLVGQTWKRVLNVMAANTAEFKRKNPHLYKVERITTQVPVANSTTATGSANKESNDATVIGHNYKRAIASKMLLLARIDKSSNTVILPTLREQFKLTFQQGTNDLIRRYYKSLIKDFAKQRQKQSRDYFTKSINLPEWNACSINLWLQNCLHDTSLDSKHTLRYAISVLNFLTENLFDDNLVKYRNKTREEEIEMDVENEKNRSKLSLETYLGGLQDRVEHVITALANFECHLAAIENFDHEADQDKPIIVYMVRQLADVIASQDFQQFANRYTTTFPWLAHTLVTFFQMFFSEFATIARNNELIFQVLKGETIAASVFDKVQAQFKDMLQDLNNAASYQKISAFQMAPSSFSSSSAPKNHDKKNFSNNTSGGDPNDGPIRKRAKGSDRTKGWYVASGSVRWPNLSEKFCIRYAQIGAFCRNEKCDFKHKMYPNHFSPEDRLIIHRYVSENDQVDFGPNVTYVPRTIERKNSEDANSVATSPKKSPKKDKNDNALDGAPDTP